MADNSAQTGKTIIHYDEEVSVPSNVETSLLIYQHPILENILLDQIIATGQADAVFRVLFNSSTIIKYFTSEQLRTLNVAFPTGLRVTMNDVIEVKVTNLWSTVADFNASFILHRSY